MIGSRETEVGAPDFIEPVLGFRAWRLRDEQIVSPYVDLPWTGETLRARCLRERVHFRPAAAPHEDPAPVFGCGCGIYAYFQPVDRAGGDPQFIRGAVVLWGRIEVHAEGMRAEFARPAVFAEPADWRRRKELHRVAERMSVEVVPPAELRPAASRHGRTLPAGFATAS